MIDQQQGDRPKEWYRCEFHVWKIRHDESMRCLRGQSAQHHRPWQMIEKYEENINARHNQHQP